MRANIRINNTPTVIYERYIVVRRCEEDASLWYYGQYDNEERANEVALKIKNGFVVEVEV